MAGVSSGTRAYTAPRTRSSGPSTLPMLQAEPVTVRCSPAAVVLAAAVAGAACAGDAAGAAAAVAGAADVAAGAGCAASASSCRAVCRRRTKEWRARSITTQKCARRVATPGACLKWHATPPLAQQQQAVLTATAAGAQLKITTTIMPHLFPRLFSARSRLEWC